MSTDDLVRRARAEVPTFALVSELADEVDRLRAERLDLIASRAEFQRAADRRTAERDAARAEADRYRTLWDRHGKNDLLAEVDRLRARNVQFLAERDAARAALERVRALTDTPHAWILVRGIEQALEGKPS